MHMSDALLSPVVGLTAAAVAGGLVVFASRRTVAEPQHARRVPLMGVMAAFVFAAQMINFSIPGTGSSGHIAGGLLLAILLGPNAAFIALTSVLTVQCLLFADGGLLALGCNILNLAFWSCFVGLPLYRLVSGATPSAARASAAAVIAAVVSLQFGAAAVVIETVLSGRSELPFAKFGAAMLGIHLPIAIVEGLVTAGVVRLMRRTGHAADSTAPHGNRVLVGAALAALITGGVLAWYASDKPDGLEWSIARVTGTEQPVSAPTKTAIMPDYQLPNSTPRFGLSMAGISGVVATGIIVALLAAVTHLTNRKSASSP